MGYNSKTGWARPALVDDFGGSATAWACRACGAPLRNVRRHLLDRVRSLWKPVRRWRCHNCGWEGLFPSQTLIRSRMEKTQRFVLFAACMLLIVLGVAIFFWLAFNVIRPATR